MTICQIKIRSKTYFLSPYDLFECCDRRGRLEKALSLGVDLCAWDLFCDARWAARARALSPLAEEAAALADTYMQMQRQRQGYYSIYFYDILAVLAVTSFAWN